MRRNAALVLSTATRSEPRAFLAGDLEQRQIDNFRGGLAGLLRAEFVHQRPQDRWAGEIPRSLPICIVPVIRPRAKSHQRQSSDELVVGIFGSVRSDVRKMP